MEYIKLALQTLKKIKLHIFVTLASAILFIFVFFPFDDLSDLVTIQVSKLTQNQIYLQFDGLDLNIIPAGIDLQKVYLETPFTPGIQADSLNLTPSIFGLIMQKPSGSISARGIFKGDLDVSISSGSATENGVARQKIIINAAQLNLAEIKSLLNLPYNLKGKANLDSTIQADLNMQEQPEADIVLNIDQFELPNLNVNTPMGPLLLPDFKFQKIQFKGKLTDGRLNIEEATLGDAKDDLSGKIKGNLILNLNNRMTPEFGAYSFELDLSASASFQDKAGLFLSFLDAYKTPQGPRARYALKVTGQNFMAPPSMSAVR